MSPPPSFTPPPPAVVHWFRRGLRLRDNPSLSAAAAAARARRAPLLCLYVLEPRPNALRQHFLRASLAALDGRLRAAGSRLLVVGGGEDAVLAAMRRFGGGALYFERETAAAARARDARVCTAVREEGWEARGVSGHTLYDVRAVVQAAGGRAPRSMAAMLTAAGKLGEPPAAVAAEETLPAPPEGLEEGEGAVPALGEFGVAEGELEKCIMRWEGGEEAGMRRLEEFLKRAGGREAAEFEKPNTSPAAWRDGEQETTGLSPHIALGTVSARVLYEAVRGAQARYPRAASDPPVSLIGQLLFREMFHACNATVPGFERMEGNAMCRQVPWGGDAAAEERWRKWESAETGFPWIDALMTQLRTEGFVHHLGRHSVACFLTRGDLWVSWERGAETFERYLIDHDEALNAANWMWLSASAFFHQYYRCYSPVAFAKRWSKAPDFIRHYLPVLKKVPDKYIFEPWTMPKGVAEKAGVKIGRDYPKPMVDHGVASKDCRARMKEAYAAARDDGDEKSGPGKKRAAASGGSGKTYKMRK